MRSPYAPKTLLGPPSPRPELAMCALTPSAPHARQVLDLLLFLKKCNLVNAVISPGAASDWHWDPAAVAAARALLPMAIEDYVVPHEDTDAFATTLSPQLAAICGPDQDLKLALVCAHMSVCVCVCELVHASVISQLNLIFVSAGLLACVCVCAHAQLV